MLGFDSKSSRHGGDLYGNLSVYLSFKHPEKHPAVASTNETVRVEEVQLFWHSFLMYYVSVVKSRQGSWDYSMSPQHGTPWPHFCGTRSEST